MKSNNNLLIFGSVLAIGTVVFILYKQNKKQKEIGGGSSESPTGSSSKDIPSTEPTKSVDPGKTSGKTSSASKKTPQLSVETVKKFQDWMDINYPNWVNGKNLNKGSGYGNFGPSTQKAYKTYGPKFTVENMGYNPNMLDTQFANAVNYLGSKGYNKNALATMPTAFVIVWADASKANAPRFYFQGYYYDTARGIKSANQSNTEIFGNKQF